VHHIVSMERLMRNDVSPIGVIRACSGRQIPDAQGSLHGNHPELKQWAAVVYRSIGYLNRDRQL